MAPHAFCLRFTFKRAQSFSGSGNRGAGKALGSRLFYAGLALWWTICLTEAPKNNIFKGF